MLPKELREEFKNYCRSIKSLEGLDDLIEDFDLKVEQLQKNYDAISKIGVDRPDIKEDLDRLILKRGIAESICKDKYEAQQGIGALTRSERKKTGREFQLTEMPDGTKRYVDITRFKDIEKVDYYSKEYLEKGLKRQEELKESSQEKYNKMVDDIQKKHALEKEKKQAKWSEQRRRLENYLEELKIACRPDDSGRDEEIIQMNIKTWKMEWDKNILVTRDEEIVRIVDEISKLRKEEGEIVIDRSWESEDKRVKCSCGNTANASYKPDVRVCEECAKKITKDDDYDYEFICSACNEAKSAKFAYVNKENKIVCRKHKE